MKNYIIVLSAALLFCGIVNAAPPEHCRHWENHGNYWCGDNASYEINDDILIIYSNNYDYAEIKITEDGRLYINDKRIKTDDHQQTMLEDYYEQVLIFSECATDIGLKGARVGICGAKIGIKAASNLFKFINPNYDTEDLEDELEREAELLEIEAELLEEKAEELEELAEQLEDFHDELKDQITELDELEWF